MLCTEDELKNKDFFISQDGNFYTTDESETLDDLARSLIENKQIENNDYVDYLINNLGYVLYEHVGKEIDIRIPKYELSGLMMSKIQKKKLVDYVLNFEQQGSSILSLTKILELDSDGCSLKMKKR